MSTYTCIKQMHNRETYLCAIVPPPPAGCVRHPSLTLSFSLWEEFFSFFLFHGETGANSAGTQSNTTTIDSLRFQCPPPFPPLVCAIDGTVFSKIKGNKRCERTRETTSRSEERVWHSGRFSCWTLTILLLISWKWISQTLSTTSSLSNVTKAKPVFFVCLLKKWNFLF